MNGERAHDTSRARAAGARRAKTVPYDTSKVVPPWIPVQVDSLNGYQSSGVGHEYTCGNQACPGGTEATAGAVLVAGVAGWSCPAAGCGYTQSWAWAWTADGSWRRAAQQIHEIITSAPLPPGPTGDAVADMRHITSGDLAGDLQAMLTELIRRVGLYEEGVSWETTCASCVQLLNSSYAQYVRSEELLGMVEARDRLITALDTLNNMYASGGTYTVERNPSVTAAVSRARREIEQLDAAQTYPNGIGPEGQKR